MHGLDVFRMVVSPSSSHSLRVSVVRLRNADFQNMPIRQVHRR